MSDSIILMTNKPVTKTKYILNKIVDIDDLEYDFCLCPLVYHEEFILSKLFIKNIKYSLRDDLSYFYSLLKYDTKFKEYKFGSNGLSWFFNNFIRKQLLKGHSIEIIRIIMSNYDHDRIEKKSLKEKIIDIDILNINEFILEYNTIYKFISSK